MFFVLFILLSFPERSRNSDSFFFLNLLKRFFFLLFCCCCCIRLSRICFIFLLMFYADLRFKAHHHYLERSETIDVLWPYNNNNNNKKKVAFGASFTFCFAAIVFGAHFSVNDSIQSDWKFFFYRWWFWKIFEQVPDTRRGGGTFKLILPSFSCRCCWVGFFLLLSVPV